MGLFIIRKKDKKIFKIQKYICSKDESEHVWCNEWYGHHIVGEDCVWYVNELSLNLMTLKEKNYEDNNIYLSNTEIHELM